MPQAGTKAVGTCFVVQVGMEVVVVGGVQHIHSKVEGENVQGHQLKWSGEGSGGSLSLRTACYMGQG